MIKENVELKLDFLKIDRKNSLELYSTRNAIEVKLSLYAFVSKYEYCNEEINTYKYIFLNLIDKWEKDQSLLSNKISHIITEILKGTKYRYVNSSSLMQKLSEREYDMDFYFFYSHIEQLSSILRLNFINMVKNNNIKNSVDFVKYLKINKVTNRIKKLTVSTSFSTCKSANISSNDLLVFPLDFINLSEIFNEIKTLKLFIPNKDFLIYDYILVLINMSWIFHNLNSIELDLDIDLEDISNTSNSDNLFKKIELMLMYCYYVSKCVRLRFLNLSLPYSFEDEIFNYLTNKENNIKKEGKEQQYANFHILDIFKKCVNLFGLEIEFNCLDSKTFKRVHCLIHLNNNIKTIKITFYPKNDEHISKLILLNLSQKESRPRLNTSSSQFLNENYEQEIDTIITKLLPNFELNMEYLYFILSSKLNTMEEITFNLDIPNIICEDDRYMTIFHKFLCNFFISIEKTKNQIKSLVIDSFNFPLNARKFQIVQSFAEKLNFSLNTSLISFTYKAKFYKVMLNDQIMPLSLKRLSIGELDSDSFLSFLKIFRNRNNLKNLEYLDISLNKYLFDGLKYYNELISLFEIEKTNSLLEIKLTTEIQITSDQLDYILNIIKRDNITYILQFSKKFLFNKIIGKDILQYNNPNIIAILFCLQKKCYNINKNILKLVVKMIKVRKNKHISIKYI